VSKKIGDVRVDVHFQSDGKELRDDVRKDPSFKEAGRSAAEQVDEGYDDQWTQDLAERIKKQEQFDKRSIAAQKGWETRRANMSKATAETMAKDSEGFFTRLSNGWRKARSEQSKADDENLGLFRRWEQRTDKFGDKIGTLFGKGARNNFMNFVGIVAGGLASIPHLATSAFANISDMFAKDVTKPMEEASGWAEGLGGSLASLAEMGPEIAIGLGGALVGLPFLLGLIASAVMLVTGAVVALAGALAFSLVGAVAVAAAALVPLAAAVGVGILAFKNMDKQAKDAFGGIKKSFTDLGQTAAQHLFKNAPADAKLLEGALDGVNGVVAGIADALRTVGEGWLKSLNSPGARKFIQFLGDTLPGMIVQIGHIAGNLGALLAEAFVAVTPLLQDFLGWLTGITGTMADLGKGKGGGKLGDFFKDIGPTMKSVGDAIGQVVGLIFDLFQGPGQKAGGDMFQSLADNVGRFRDFLKKAKKDGSLQQFFDDAKKFAGAIGDALVAVGKLMAALDDPATRKFIIWLIQSFTTLIGLVTWYVNKEVELAHKIGQAFGWVKDRVKDAVKAIKNTFAPVGPWIHRALSNISWDGLKKGAKNAWNSIKSTFAPVGPWFTARWHTISSAFQNAMSAVGRAASSAWTSIRNGAANMASAVHSRVNDIVSWFNGLTSRLGGIASHFGSLASDWASAVMSSLRSLPGDIVSLFSGLASRIIHAIGSIDLTPHINWPSPPGWLSKIHTASGGVFAGAQMRIIGEAGPEAVVPLTGPLSAVDPAVRALAAFARGGGGGQVTTRGGRTVDVGGITVITPNADPRAVASQVVNRLAASSYI
jgi:hypothetical protein